MADLFSSLVAQKNSRNKAKTQFWGQKLNINLVEGKKNPDPAPLGGVPILCPPFMNVGDPGVVTMLTLRSDVDGG